MVPRRARPRGTRVSATVLLASAALLAYVAVGGLRTWARRRRMIDVPNERSSHTRPTPRGGGLAIAVVTLGGLLVVHLGVVRRPLDVPALGYLAGAGLVALVSWTDDVRSLSSLTRLVAHALGAAIAILALGHWTAVAIPGVGELTLGWLGLPLTAVWLIGLTNAYNFMDGIDGIAAGQGVVAGLAWFAIGSIAGEPLVSTLGLLLAGSCLGFLGHNWPPARIFMGDVGSAFLGYSFAVLPMLLSRLSGDARLRALAPVLGCLIVWPFVFDATITFLRRLARRENVLAAHRSHVYQRLVIAGRSHRCVTSLYVALAAAGALAAVLLAGRPAAPAALLGTESVGPVAVLHADQGVPGE